MVVGPLVSKHQVRRDNAAGWDRWRADCGICAEKLYWPTWRGALTVLEVHIEERHGLPD